MRLLLDILTVYAIYALSIGIVIRKSIGKTWFPFAMVAWAAPLIGALAFVSLARDLFLRAIGNGRMIPAPPVGLEEAEQQIETERFLLYGGKYRDPHVAPKWKKLYQQALEREAARVEKYAGKYLTA